LHRKILDKLLELLSPGHKVGLTIDFNQDADLTPTVNIGANHSLLCRASSPLCGSGQSFLTKKVNGFFNITAIFGERFFTVDNASTRSARAVP
jgi:hypothetical protein